LGCGRSGIHSKDLGESGGARRTTTPLYTKEGAAGNEGRGEGSGKEISELSAAREAERKGGGGRERVPNIPLDNSRYNKYNAGAIGDEVTITLDVQFVKA
jgi:hypothetical protein